MQEKWNEYAKLLVEVGANVQKGQTLMLSSPIECAPFARLCASAAYGAGCREVVVIWGDDALNRERFLRADDAVFDEVPAWTRHLYNDYAEENAAFLAISARDPEALRGVDPKRISRSQLARFKALDPFYTAQMNNSLAWCIGSVPIPSWAKKVFPDVDEREAMDRLWDAIFEAVRIKGDGKAVERWREHLALMDKRTQKLNELHFKTLHYTNSLGTDLTIELPADHVWAAGAATTPRGQIFVANMPTEEIFTAPLKTGVNGVVYAALPLVVNGNVVDGFHFVLKDGKIVEAHAKTGEEFLKAAISVDENACYLGEVALVPYDSPISNQNILYYNTLFDENARCHLAFGRAYPECVEGGDKLSNEELEARGLNQSAAHNDFMIGTADLSIVGATADGREIPVFTEGNFAI
ncbi:MAG: aminopeptidase [Ruminococcaceae bacterium]|jgi:aminopeptidase|nr:aminopeptidase [Oscillospiraceae bacterium]